MYVHHNNLAWYNEVHGDFDLYNTIDNSPQNDLFKNTVIMKDC